MREESQRLMSLLRGERVARPPLFEPWFAMGQMLNAHYGGSYLDMADQLGHAAVPIGGLNVGMKFIHRAESQPESGAWYDGGLLESVEQLRNDPEPDYDAQVDDLRRKRDEAGERGSACWVVIGWCFDRMSANMSLENLAMACYDDPDFVREAMATYEARNQQAVERILAKVIPDFVLYNGDCAYKTGPMIHPDMIRDFCFEPSKKTVDQVRDLGIPFAFHTDGKLDAILPILLDLGICAVHGCEKQANDLSHLVETFGDDIALCGNMDVVFMKHASVEEVVIRTRQMLDVGSRKQRFIAGCNTSPMDYIPVENYQAMCRTIADYEPSA